jgi:GDP-L-fucose synthase
MEKNSRIFVAGHKGLVGSAITRRLQRDGYTSVLLRDRKEVDLCNQSSVNAFFEKARPEYVFLSAAKVGGILANSTYPADFIRDNLLIQTFVIDAAHRFGTKKIEVLGSSCIYPKFAPQPMKEEHLLTGALEETNEWYAVAKIAGIKTAQAYHKQYGLNAISLMPTNLYGPGDYFDLEKSHVLPALLRRFHEAKLANKPYVTVWGTGSPRREFLYVDDLADAAVYLMQTYNSPEIVNVGVGDDVSIKALAETVKEVTGFAGELKFDTAKPDGTPRKLLDVSRLTALGWKAKMPLRKGIEETYAWFLKNGESARK